MLSAAVEIDALGINKPYFMKTDRKKINQHQIKSGRVNIFLSSFLQMAQPCLLHDKMQIRSLVLIDTLV